jgi:CHAT domain-containing protein
LTPKPQPHPRVLAAAFTKGYYKVQIDNQILEFSGLPFAGREVESLAKLMPGTTKLLDRDFSKRATLPRMNDYNILHFATHAAFLIGKPEDSFILFGDGEWATLRDIENWSLPKVDLVVLSACETGLGGLGDGVEILGLGYQFQRTGARAAIASLWAVNDSSTEFLMNAFYDLLQQGKTKAEAMRQAQLKMLHIQSQTIASDRSSVNFTVPQNASTNLINHDLSHPYYWAPFILIGNGL